MRVIYSLCEQGATPPVMIGLAIVAVLMYIAAAPRPLTSS